LCVVTTHIFWKPNCADVKIRQTQMLLHELHLFLTEHGLLDFQRTILCGDFNCTPTSGIYHFVQKGTIDLHQWKFELLDDIRNINTTRAQFEEKLRKMISLDFWQLNLSDRRDISRNIQNQKNTEKIEEKNAECQISTSTQEEKIKNSKCQISTPTKEDKFKEKTSECQISLPTQEEKTSEVPKCQISLPTQEEKNTQFPKMYQDTKLVHPFDFVSSYSTYSEGHEVVYTTYAHRYKGCVDYIFMTRDLTPVRVLPLPSDFDLERLGGIPGNQCGSDHFMLMSEFLIPM